MNLIAVVLPAGLEQYRTSRWDKDVPALWTLFQDPSCSFKRAENPPSKGGEQCVTSQTMDVTGSVLTAFLSLSVCSLFPTVFRMKARFLGKHLGTVSVSLNELAYFG